MVVWLVPLAVVVVGLVTTAGAVARVAEELRRVGDAVDRCADLRRGWRAVRRETAELAARLDGWRRR